VYDLVNNYIIQGFKWF